MILIYYLLQFCQIIMTYMYFEIFFTLFFHYIDSSKKLSPLSESFSHINIIYPLHPHAPTDYPPFPDTCRVRPGV